MMSKKENKMSLQDLNLYQVEQAWEKVCKTRNTCRMRWTIPNIFFKLAEKKKPLNTDESYIDRRAKDLKTKHSCTIKGIKALSRLAEKGDTGAMRVLSDYFKQKGEDVINEWTHKRNLQAVADRIVERERKEKEKEKERKEKEREKEKEKERKEKEKEREKEKKQYIKEQLPIKKAQIEKYGCIMPKGLMKGK